MKMTEQELLKCFEKLLPESNVSEFEIFRAGYDSAFCNTEKLELDELITKAAHAFDVEPETIISPTRLRAVVAARCVVFNEMRKKGYRLSYIAETFGRTHATVINGVKNYEAWSRFDKQFQKKLEIFYRN